MTSGHLPRLARAVEHVVVRIVSKVSRNRQMMQGAGTGRKRIVQLRASLPSHLLTSRSITSLHDIHPSFWIGDLIPLLVPSDTPILPRLLQAGATQSKSGAPVIRRGSPVDLQTLDDVLPFVAKQMIVPRCGDSIPATSWGSNLHHLLVPDQWEQLRRKTFAESGGHCEICGFWNGLECHELWEYHEPVLGLSEMVCGVQRLVRLMPLCKACHETYHLGFASMQGRIAPAGGRVGAYNRYTLRETKEYCDLNKENWQRRNEHPWALDLSCMASSPLVIRRTWRRNEDGTTVAKTRLGESQTIILGVAWQCGKESYPAVPTDEGYFE